MLHQEGAAAGLLFRKHVHAPRNKIPCRGAGTDPSRPLTSVPHPIQKKNPNTWWRHSKQQKNKPRHCKKHIRLTPIHPPDSRSPGFFSTRHFVDNPSPSCHGNHSLSIYQLLKNITSYIPNCQMRYLHSLVV